MIPYIYFRLNGRWESNRRDGTKELTWIVDGDRIGRYETHEPPGGIPTPKGSGYSGFRWPTRESSWFFIETGDLIDRHFATCIPWAHGAQQIEIEKQLQATPGVDVTESWIRLYPRRISLLLVLPAILWIAYALLRKVVAFMTHESTRIVRPANCPTCGYDLRASTERCPECGWIPPPAVNADELATRLSEVK